MRILWLSGSNAKNNAELLSACTHWDSLHVTRYARVPKARFRAGARYPGNRDAMERLSAGPTKRHYRYEKAHEASSNIISAIAAIKLIPRLNLRIRRLNSGALFFSSRLNGVPLTASTKRKSFTCRF